MQDSFKKNNKGHGGHFDGFAFVLCVMPFDTIHIQKRTP